MSYVVHLLVDEQVIATKYSYHTMAKTLRLGWELMGGIPCAEVTIRKAGDMKAWLKCNHRGELVEVDIYGPTQAQMGASYPVGLVVPMNPNGPLFRDVFAGKVVPNA